MASSLSSEMEAEHHPFLDCPKGSYDLNQTKKGLHIRVDMPGVPPGRVKLFKYSASRTVTFTGRAPKDWEFDSEERVYGGYVALNTDPNKLDVEMTVINGCLRLFFPGAEGSLHFFPNKSPTQENAGVMINYPCEHSIECADQSHHDREPNVILGRVKSMGSHDSNCPCCNGKRGYIKAINPKSSYTNPALLKGVQGVCESKLVHTASGTHMFLRVDMPGIEEKESVVTLNNEHLTVIGEDNNLKYYVFFGANCPKEHRYDKHPRAYICVLMLQCDCCEVQVVAQAKKDGVYRLLFQKMRKNENAPIQRSKVWVDGNEMLVKKLSELESFESSFSC